MNLRRKDNQAYKYKYPSYQKSNHQYQNEQNHFCQEDFKNNTVGQNIKILQTISQQGITQQKGSISNRQQTTTRREGNRRSSYYNNKSPSDLTKQKLNVNQCLSQRLHSKDKYDLQKFIPKQECFNLNRAGQKTFIENKKQNQSQKQNYKQLSARNQANAQIHPYMVGYKGYQQAHNLQNQINNPIKRPISNCMKCKQYDFKIQQLTSSYELLVRAKNQQLEECKYIILKLQQKMKIIEQQNHQEIQRNKKFRHQIQKKNSESYLLKQKQSQIVEYLKNRELILLEQMKEMQNQYFVKQFKVAKKNRAKTNKKENQNYFQIKSNSKNDKFTFNSDKLGSSISSLSSSGCNIQQNSARRQQKQNQKVLKEQINNQKFRQRKSNQKYSFSKVKNSRINFQSQVNKGSFYKSSSSQRTYFDKDCTNLSDRVPLSEIVIKDNQIQILKDNLMVEQLKVKIQITKNLQTQLSVS